ncbi:unnamed protein product [Protopolystoma xenopodis]|uniref:Uncharacterized protein n=1 Tax=Protopolystoma xenopodis TaxID=117903 RepID=A0A3S4ZZS1_9PLAT|nr:unnamed protein product [Protopolystoma xenopodis]
MKADFNAEYLDCLRVTHAFIVWRSSFRLDNLSTHDLYLDIADLPQPNLKQTPPTRAASPHQVATAESGGLSVSSAGRNDKGESDQASEILTSKDSHDLNWGERQIVPPNKNENVGLPTPAPWQHPGRPYLENDVLDTMMDGLKQYDLIRSQH